MGFKVPPQKKLRGPYSASELYRLTTATCRRNLLPTFVDRRVSRGQRGVSPTVVNLSFLDRVKVPNFIEIVRATGRDHTKSLKWEYSRHRRK
jgi:hypothetical protein